MCSLVHSPGFEGSLDIQSVADLSKGSANLHSFFRTIPPERVGLNGEYDHSGLAKRVEQLFRKKFQLHQLEQLSITQRGRVVILAGRVSDEHLLKQLVETALEVMGTTYVETHAVFTLGSQPKTAVTCSNENCSLSASSSYV